MEERMTPFKKRDKVKTKTWMLPRGLAKPTMMTKSLSKWHQQVKEMRRFSSTKLNSTDHSRKEKVLVISTLLKTIIRS
jgi:hypothetical protein